MMKAPVVASLYLKLEQTIREALQLIDRNTCGIALIVDADQRLLGTVTDGDIRRAILAGADLHTPVSVLLERKAGSLYAEPVTAPAGAGPDELLHRMRERSVRQIPLLDEARRVVGLATLDQLLPEHQGQLQAVIMAGGFGKRLLPLTEHTPKPMLLLGGRPLLEHTIDQLRAAGIHAVNITTHYLAEKIVEHFGDGSEFGVRLNYVPEERPLGTAGALGLIERPSEPVLVINGDVLTRVDFRALLAYHREHSADLTVAVRQYEMKVPYGVIEGDGPYVRQIREKPDYRFLVNAGIYLLNPSVYAYIPAGERFDMTDLIQALLDDGRTVVSFPVVEYWLDIGQPADYERAEEDFRSGRIVS
ncbi:MAG TPA: nucleotidyltransferase family protein [Chloroflexaceae bacterium]|nr:nucleotidyltransferase family protein [Chloroflexaceae bacterium]